MSVPDIPGFYFDAIKGKYFKEQPHHLVPTGAKYSQSTVKTVREEEQRERQALARAAERKQKLVQRSQILSRVGKVTLGREAGLGHLGTAGRARLLYDARAEIYATSLRSNWHRDFEKVVGRDVISAFAYDNLTGDIIVGHDNEHSGHTLSTFHHEDKQIYRPVYVRPRSEITSISISDGGRVALVTTFGGTMPDPRNGHSRDVPAEIHIMVLTGNETAPPILEHGLSPAGRLDCDLRISYFHTPGTDVWTSSANPLLPNSFAVGMSDKVVLYSNAESGVWDDSHKMYCSSPAYSLEWLAPQLLTIGQRDGTVKLWDTRSDRRASAALVLQHPGPVSHIQSADPSRLVVNGRCPTDGLCMYDLRHLAPLKEQKRKRDAKSVRQQNNTQPLIVYEHEGNLRSVGFDISVESGLIAAVDAKNRVKMYTLHGGKRVHSNPIIPSAELPTRMLRFVNAEDGHEELLACNAGTMWSVRA